MFLSREHPNLFQITQNALIRNAAGGALILKHAKTGKWLLPGGKLRIGETWFEGFAREMKEETGIVEFTITDILEVDSWDEHGETFYAVIFACDVPAFESLVLSKEHIEHAWVDLDSISGFEFYHPAIKQRLLRFLANIPTPTVKRGE